MTPITLIAILIMSGAIMIYLYVKFIDFLVKYRERKEKLMIDKWIIKSDEKYQDIVDAECIKSGHQFYPISSKNICIRCGKETK